MGAYTHSISRIHAPQPAGVSICQYGDEPNPRLLSVNSIFLVQETASFLRSHAATQSFGAKSADAEECVAGTVRHLGPNDGVEPHTVICVGKPGSVRGGWTQCGDIFYLNYYSPSDAVRSNSSRLAGFLRMVRAVVANIGRCTSSTSSL